MEIERRELRFTPFFPFRGRKNKEKSSKQRRPSALLDRKKLPLETRPQAASSV